MKITIETIDHNDQRYNTIGDWQSIGDTLVIKVSETGNIWYNILAGIHELVEAVLCYAYSITQQQVDEFDMNHPELDEPGDSKDAPYHEQHKFASLIEKLLAIELDADWGEYENNLEEILDSWRK